MKRLYLLVTCLFVLEFILFGFASAQQSKGSTSAPMTDLEKKLYEAAKKEGTFVWWDQHSLKDATAFIDLFKKRYPGIDVKYWEAIVEVCETKFFAEQAAGITTVDQFEINRFGNFKGSGIPSDLSELVKDTGYNKNFVEKDGLGAAFEHTVCGAAYNTDSISPKEAPRSWEALLDSKWKGKIAFEESLNFFIWNTENWGEEKTVDYLKKVRDQKPLFINGPTQLTTLLSTGEYAIGVCAYLHRAMEQQDKGAPVNWAPINLLTDDSKIGFNIIPKTAPHPNAARLWMRWWMTPEAQLSLHEGIRRKGDPSPGTGTKASKYLEKMGVEGLKIFTPTTWTADNYDRLRKKYQDAIGFVTK